MKTLSRRRFFHCSASLGLLSGLGGIIPARGFQPGPESNHNRSHEGPINLHIALKRFRVGERTGMATAINGTIPGPVLRLREGTDAVLRVTNQLDEDTSIHWHGLILPFEMDGVPGVSFAGIRPGQTFTYKFPVRQHGTYWYHSHSGFQEQTGVYGALIIDPAEPDPIKYDREHVIILSDWTFENPHRVLMNLKKEAGYYNFQRRTARDLFRDISKEGFKATLKDRLMWSRMRMDPTDIADITAYTYTSLINGLPPEAHWTGLFKAGERIRLRFINAAAATYFDIRIPGLEMTVVQVDGQNVQPVTVDEIRAAIAETYDVIIQPKTDRAYTLFAETMDRSGFALGMLAPRQGMTAEMPERRKRPLLTMADMGMVGMQGHTGKIHGAVPGAASSSAHANHAAAQPTAPPADPHAGHGQKMAVPEKSVASGDYVMHGPDHHGPGNSSVAMISKSRLDEPGVGLENMPWRVLLYSELRSLKPGTDSRSPSREIEIHLTGNMEKFIWGIDGKKFSEAQPIRFQYGERLRLTMVNDTMMNHPMHLHGMWMELDNGAGPYKPRKHTINVKPAERISVDITADAPGNWAFHCHILYHMEVGMFRVVAVTQHGGHAS